MELGEGSYKQRGAGEGTVGQGWGEHGQVKEDAGGRTQAMLASRMSSPKGRMPLCEKVP